MLYDIDKAGQYISKLEIKFYANTEKLEQVPVKSRDVWYHGMFLQSPLDIAY